MRAGLEACSRNVAHRGAAGGAKLAEVKKLGLEIDMIAPDHGIIWRKDPNKILQPADVDDILLAFARGDAEPAVPAAADFAPPSLARAEWEHINRVLSDADGNISEAARRLKVHRRSLQRKLQKYPPKD